MKEEEKIYSTKADDSAESSEKEKEEISGTDFNLAETNELKEDFEDVKAESIDPEEEAAQTTCTDFILLDKDGRPMVLETYKEKGTYNPAIEVLDEQTETDEEIDQVDPVKESRALLKPWEIHYAPDSEDLPHNSKESRWQNIPKRQKVIADSLSSGLKRSLALYLILAVVASGFFSYNLGLRMGKNDITLPSLNINQSDTSKRQDQIDRTDFIVAEPISTPLSVSQVSYLTADSVVEIQTERTLNDWRLGQVVSTGAGSGVIISDDGYLLTNHHVIADAETIVIVLRNGDSYPAILVGSDSKTDIALLKIAASNLTTAVFGDSSTLVVGETAIAIGNPLGTLGGTVTNGIISALNRDIILDGKSMNLLQTNAAINPGNSGGGLFNEYAELIGIVVAKSSGVDVEGLAFAIPINDVKEILDDLMTYGYVQGRINLRMTLQDVSGFYSLYSGYRQGVYIAGVEIGSNAEKIGLKAGDFLTSIDDISVSSISDLNQVLEKYKVGDTVKVTILRNNRNYSGNLELEAYGVPKG